MHKMHIKLVYSLHLLTKLVYSPILSKYKCESKTIYL